MYLAYATPGFTQAVMDEVAGAFPPDAFDSAPRVVTPHVVAFTLASDVAREPHTLETLESLHTVIDLLAGIGVTSAWPFSTGTTPYPEVVAPIDTPLVEEAHALLAGPTARLRSEALAGLALWGSWVAARWADETAASELHPDDAALFTRVRKDVAALLEEAEVDARGRVPEWDAWNRLAIPFKASVYRSGSKRVHSRTSPAVAGALGGAWQKNMPGWPVSMHANALDVTGWWCGDVLVLGLPVLPPRTRLLQRRVRGMYRPTQQGSSLQPSVAAALLHAAGPISREAIVIDVTGGTGTLPIEAATSTISRCGYAISGDISRDNAERGRSNVVAALSQLYRGRGGSQEPAPMELATWDATALPLRSNTVDVVVADLPFGQRCGASKFLRKAYPLMVSETARVLAPLGTAVLFTPLSKKVMTPILAAAPPVTLGLVLVSVFAVNLTNIVPLVLVFRAVSSEADLAAVLESDAVTDPDRTLAYVHAADSEARADLLNAWFKAARRVVPTSLSTINAYRSRRLHPRAEKASASHPGAPSKPAC